MLWQKSTERKRLPDFAGITLQGAKIKDNYGVIDTTVWKEEDGKLFYDTKINGTVMDEPVSSFAEINEAEDGTIRFNAGFTVLERV